MDIEVRFHDGRKATYRDVNGDIAHTFRKTLRRRRPMEFHDHDTDRVHLINPAGVSVIEIHSEQTGG